MNEFTKENKSVSTETLSQSYHSCIVSIDALLDRIKREREVSLSNRKELTILIPNYASCIKTIICRYLKNSGYSNQRINNYSTTELFFKFKKEITKDNKGPCLLSHELHLVVLNIRNKLSHSLNQVEYISNIIDNSGVKKIIGLLDRLSIESKEIEQYFDNKMKQVLEEKINISTPIQREKIPFGIVY